MLADLDIAVASAAEPRVLALAGELAQTLEGLGRRASVLVDRLPAHSPGRITCLVVPHAGYDAWAGAHADQVAGRLRHTVALCPGQLSLDAALALRDARGVLALRPDALSALRMAGLEPVRLPPGWAGEVVTGAERDLDVVVCEGWSAERWRVLARCARVLDGRRCDLRASYVGGPRAGVEHLPDTAGRRALLRRARIALVVGSGTSLDLLAAVEAAACGAVVLTDARVDLAPFVPGTSIVRADAAAMPAALDALLADPARLGRIAGAAAGLVRALPLARAAAVLAGVAEHGGSAPGHRPVRGSVPIALPGAAEPTAIAPIVVETLAELRRVRRRLDGLERPDATVAPPLTTPAWAAARPALSVVIPLHDYGAFVEAACASVVAAVGVEAELIVVDDASGDDGPARVEEFLAAHPQLPAALTRLRANAGISGARNHGATLARSPLLLFLDADDELLPHGPSLLMAALAGDPGAAFAYGLLAVEGPEGPRGLLSAEPWNPDLLRDGNYINALALVRADAYRAIGGFRADGPLELGWEDFDFWLRMADTGRHGVHVRQIVARYRAHPGSRSATADVVAPELMSYLQARYPAILGSEVA